MEKDTPDQDNEKLYSLQEAAALLGFTEDEMRRRAEVGRIPSQRREGSEYWFSYQNLKDYERIKWWGFYKPYIIVGAIALIAVISCGAIFGTQYNNKRQSRILVLEAEKHIKKNELKQAAALYQKAVYLDPRNENARLSFARILARSNYPKLQEEQLRAVLKMNPNSVDALQGLGMLKMQQDRLDDAEALFHRILQLEPNHFQANYFLAAIYARQGNIDKAKKHINKVVKMNPDFAPAGIILADIYATENKLDSAMALYKSKGGGNLTSQLNQAIILQKKGKYKQAETLYLSIIQYEPVLATAYNNMAWEMISNPDADKETLQKAFNLAQRAYIINPRDATIADTLAWILHLAGKNDEAIKLLDRALQLSPNLAVAHYHKGRLNLDIGNNDAALDSFQKAKKLAGKSNDPSIAGLDHYIKLAKQNKHPVKP